MKPSMVRIIQCIVLALAACSISTATTASYNANYDNLVGAIGTGEVSVGIYENLIYKSWIVRPDNTSLVGGYAPHSLFNTILTFGLLQAINGTPTFTVASPYTSAEFKSFYFACDLQTEEDIADESVQCIITVAGFQKNGNQETAVASFTATPPLNLVGRFQMVQAVLPSSFNKVYAVTVIQDDPTTQALAVDNLVYTVSK